MPPTIKDVATRAGVSTATVSYVINGTQRITEETRERVLRAMTELQYRPSALARSLRVRRTKTVALLVPYLSNQFFTDAAHGIEEVLQRNGYNLIISESTDDPENEKRLLQAFDSLLVDGLILVPCDPGQDYAAKALSSRCPTVFLDRRPLAGDCDAVVLDNCAGTYEAVSLLIRMGHRRIAMLLGAEWYSTTHDRMRGFEKALREAKLKPAPKFIRHADYGLGSGITLTHEVLTRRKPSAIFSASAQMTLGVFLKTREMRLRIPEDVAIIGCGDLAWAKATEPPLSMIYQPSSEMGKRAAELLLKRIEHPAEETGKCEIIYLPTKLRMRGSC